MAEVAGLFAAIPSGRLVLVDGLVFSVIPEIAERESGRLRLVALVHLPLAADVTRDRDDLRELEGAERRALLFASGVVATGKATLPLLARYKLKTTIVVEPGTDPAPLALGSGGQRLELLTVATIHAGKGPDSVCGTTSWSSSGARVAPCQVTGPPLSSSANRAVFSSKRSS